MTTEHIHHEHSDGDTSVVEYPSALETIIDSTIAETATSVETYGEVGIPSSELTTPTLPSEETHQDPAASQGSLDDFVHGVTAPQEAVSICVPCSDTQDALAELSLACGTAEDAVLDTLNDVQPIQEATMIPEVPSAVLQQAFASAGTGSDVALELITLQPSSQGQASQEPLVPETTQEITAIPAQFAHPLEIKPLLTSKAEEIRPFTDFIEEFRQAEAARLQTSLHETQVETFTLLSSAESVFAASSSTNDIADSTATVPGEQNVLMTTSHRAEATAEALIASARSDKNGLVPPTLSSEHTVSPLLRPATRLRVPRHGGGRHHREEQATVAETPTPVQQQPEPTAQTMPCEPAGVTTPPKPARRYRFDRPRPATTASTNGTNGTYGINSSLFAATNKATTSPLPVGETRSSVTPPRGDLETLKEQQVESQITPPIEQPIASRETVSSAELTSSTTVSSSSQLGRRRHTQKEQPTAPAPAIQVTAAPIAEVSSTVELVALPEEVVLAELPPLEYSELQKANSRRRRRHRSGSSNAVPTIPTVPKAPVAPAVPPMPQPSPMLMPQIPTTPVSPPVVPQHLAGTSTYAIVSGYTVSQMNQGNDDAGPFMGPEPSPARGSGLGRDGRTTTRTGAQRIPPSPPRTGDTGVTAASLNQFATIVSQAIETQTDRMVTELRRASQAPTNVSVSLPPFPSSERVGVFVDVANLLYSARTLRIAVDFGKLLDFLRGNRRLIRAHAYCPTSPQPGDEQMFLQAVKGLGYRITTKNYKTFSSGAKKADLDLDLCMDVVRLVDGKAVDCIVLLSGDSDFMPMLDYCSDHGVRVEVAAFDEAMSATLRQSCDLFINLSMLEDIRA